MKERILEIFEFAFSGRKPSVAQVTKKVKEGVKSGADIIDVWWGENTITIEKSTFTSGQNHWFGYGWIKGISGSDLAHSLNGSV